MQSDSIWFDMVCLGLKLQLLTVPKPKTLIHPFLAKMEILKDLILHLLPSYGPKMKIINVEQDENLDSHFESNGDNPD